MLITVVPMLARPPYSPLRNASAASDASTPCCSKPSRGRRASAVRCSWRSLEFHLEGLQSLRYVHYRQSLLNDAPDADLVMITDLRDVVFQGDPLADPVTGLEVYLEDDSERIGADGF